MKKVAIAGTAKTPVGSFGGIFKTVPAVELGVIAAKETIKRVGIEPDQVEEAVVGNVLRAGPGQNVARQVVLGTGCPITIPAMTLNRVCDPNLRAVSLAAQVIRAGDIDVVLASGTESTLCSPCVIPDVRRRIRMNNEEIVDEMIKDGLWNAFNDCHMGITAENVAKKYNITREMQDQSATVSRNHAEKAHVEDLFDEETVPVEVKGRKGTKMINKDEHIRGGVTLEGISGLKPAFSRDGSGTIATVNAFGINDGAAMLVIMNEEKAKELRVKPLATTVNYASAGVDSAIAGTGPTPFSRKTLEKSGWGVKDVDLIEADEALAAQANVVAQKLQLDMDKASVNDGAIAVDHLIGANGVRILTTLLYAMKYRGAEKGLTTLHIGGGVGVALTIERN